MVWIDSWLMLTLNLKNKNWSLIWIYSRYFCVRWLETMGWWIKLILCCFIELLQICKIVQLCTFQFSVKNRNLFKSFLSSWRSRHWISSVESQWDSDSYSLTAQPLSLVDGALRRLHGNGLDGTKTGRNSVPTRSQMLFYTLVAPVARKVG